jgi:PIN domain nuclease of toxin-antitoxin system
MTLTHRLKISRNTLDARLARQQQLFVVYRGQRPIERLIIAQALAEEVPVISSDAAFSPYAVKLIW